MHTAQSTGNHQSRPDRRPEFLREVCLHQLLSGTESEPRRGRDFEGPYSVVSGVCKYCGRSVRLMTREEE